MKKLLKVLLSFGFTLGVTGAPLHLGAQTADNFPSKPISIYVPFGPGSGSDVFARYFGEKLSEKIGEPVVVENKPGAGGAIAMNALRSAAADGHTILLGSNSPMAANVSVFKELPFDPVEDTIPISGLSRSMAVIAVPKSSEINNLDDLITAAKQGPGLNTGTYSPGYELAAAPFLDQAEISWQIIPYKGLAQTTTDLMGNQIDVAVIDTPGTVDTIRSGQIRAIAVTGDDRHPELPEVPTLEESGYKDAIHYSWTAFWVHSDTPPEIIETLSETMLDILAQPESKEFVSKSSAEIMPYNSDEMREFQLNEIERFATAVDTLGFEQIE